MEKKNFFCWINLRLFLNLIVDTKLILLYCFSTRLSTMNYDLIDDKIYAYEINPQLYEEKIVQKCNFCITLGKGNRAYEVKIVGEKNYLPVCFCCWINLRHKRPIPELNCGCNK